MRQLVMLILVLKFPKESVHLIYPNAIEVFHYTYEVEYE